MRFLTVWGLLPLDRRDGLGGEVEEDAVDAVYLVGDTFGDVLQKLEGDVLDGGGHRVGGVDSAQDDGPCKGAFAVLDADALEIGNDGEVLPYSALESVLRELFAQDRVRLADAFETVAGDRAEAAYAQSGTGERLTEYHIIGQTQRLADDSYFVLEQQLDRLDQLELQILGQTADVVVRLDAVCGLEDVGVDGALSEEGDVVELAGFFFKYADELGADDLAFCLGIGDACELIEEAVDSVDVDEVGVHLIAENLDDLFGLALTEKSVVDMDADELLTDRLDQKRRDDRAVNAAGEREQNLFVADLRTEFCDLFVDKRLREFRGGDSFHCFGSYIS